MSSFFRDIVLRFSGEDAGVSKAVDGINSRVDGTKASLADIGGVAKKVGGALTKSVTLPVAAMAAAATKAAIDYESAFAGVRKTVDMTEEQYEKLYDATLALSETQPVSAESLFAIEEMAGQLGITNDKLLSFSETVAGLDVATNLSAEDAATEMARFINITGESQSNISNLGSAVVDLGNNFATTESEIMAMSMRLAAGTTSVHISSAETLGLAAAMSSLGIEAEAGGSSVSTVLAKLDKAVAHNGPALEEFAKVSGMTAQEFSDAWRSDPMKAFEDFIVGLGQVEGEGGNLNLVLEDLGITELRQVDALKRLSSGWGSVGGAIDTATDAYSANTALQEEVDKRNDTTQAKLETLKNKVANAAAEVGGPLAEALIDVVDDLEPLIQGVSNAATWFANLDSDAQGAVLTVAGIAAATGPAITAVGEVTTAIDGIGTAFGLLPGAAAAADGGITLSNAKKSARDVGTEAKNAGRAFHGGAEALDAAASTADAAITMATSKAAVKDVGDAAKTSGKALHGGADALDAAASAADAAITMSTSKAAVKEVGEEATTAAKLIGGESDSLVAAASAADAAITMKTATGEVENVGKAASTVADTDLPKVSTAIETVDGKTTAKVVDAVGDIGTEAVEVAAAGIDAAASAVDTLDGKTTSKVVDAVSDVGDAGVAAVGAATGGGITGLQVALVALGAAAVIGAIALVYSHLMDIKEQADRVTNATDGIEGSMARLNEADTANTVDALSTMAADAKTFNENIKESADKAIGLFDKLAGQELENGADAANVERYAGIIKDLSSQTELTASEQLRLSDAVEQFNGITGASISIINAQTGEISANAEEIDGLVESYKEMAKAQGYQDALVALYAQEASASADLAQAQGRLEQSEQALAAAQKERDEAYANYDPNVAPSYYEGLDTAVNEATAAVNANRESVETAQAVYDGTEATIAYFNERLDEQTAATEEVTDSTEEMGEASSRTIEYTSDAITVTEDHAAALAKLQQELDGVVDAMEDLVKAHPDLAAAMAQAGLDAASFATLLDQTGTSAEWLGGVIDSMAQASDPFSQIEVHARGANDEVSNLAITTGEMLNNMQTDQATIEQWAEDIKKLYSMADTQDEIDYIDSLVSKGPEYATEVGYIAERWEQAQIASEEYGSALDQLGEAYGNVQRAQDQAAFDVAIARANSYLGLVAQGAATLKDTYDEASGHIIRTIETDTGTIVAEVDSQSYEIVGVITGLEGDVAQASGQVSQAAVDEATRVMSEGSAQIGEATGTSMSEGIDSADVEGAADGAKQAVLGELSDMPDEAEARGKVAGWSLGSGIGSQDGEVQAAAQTLSGAAMTELDGTPDLAQAAGENTGASYADGVSSQEGAASGAGSSVSAAASSALSTYAIDAYWHGHEMGSNFAAGLSASTSLVSAAANEVAGAAAAPIHFTEPKVGPLVGINDSGAEMVRNYAASMMSEVDRVAKAAMFAAGAARLDSSWSNAQVHAGAVTNVYVNGTYNDDAAVQRVTGEYIRDMVELGAM